MAKGFEIAEGYLDIEADVDGALADVRRFFKEVDGELKAEEKAFSQSGEKSGKGYVKGLERSGGDIDRTFKAFANRAFNVAQEEGRRRNVLAALFGGGKGGGGASIGRSILGGLTGALRRARGLVGKAFSGLGSGLSNLFSGGKALFSGIASGISSAVSDGLDKAKELWKSASGAFSSLSSAAGGAGGVIQFAAMGAAIPIALGLAGALTHLAAAALALPAALGVLVAAIAPAIVAFQGFGEAVGAGLSGDVEKFNEALKGLTPSARTVAKEFVKLGPALKEIKRITQESLFNQLIGQFDKLGSTLLPALATGMSGVAGALGHLIALFLQLLSAPGTIEMINNLFYTTTRIIDTLAEPLVNAFGGFLALINAGLPWVLKFVSVLADGLQAAADWMVKITAPGGKFTGWMERAWNVGVKLWNVLKGLGEFAGTILSSLGDEGTDTLRGMGDAIAKVNEYLKSAEGQETLHNLGVLVHWAGNAFVALLGSTVAAYKGLNMVFSFVRGIGPFFSNLWENIVGGVKAVGTWFAWLGTTIWGGITSAASAVGGFFVMIWNGLVTAFNFVVEWGGKIVNWFASLPALIGGFIMALPGMIANGLSWLANAILYGLGYIAGFFVKLWMVDIPAYVSMGVAWLINTVTGAINFLVALWNAFPGLVMAALSGFWGWITGAFSAAWDWVKMVTSATVNDLVARAKALPGQVTGALSSLGSMLAGVFSRAWNWVKQEVSSGIDGMMNFVRSIPGRVTSALSGAGSWLVSAGKDMIRGLANGIEDMLSWAVNKAKAAAQRIKQGFLDALDIGSPSKVMQKEVGHWILPGVMRGMQDTEPQLQRYLGNTADMISGMRPTVNVAAPNVSVGGVTLLADLGDGIRRAIPVVLMDSAATVAAAAQVGNRTRTGWTNTGRSVITTAGG